MDASGGAAMSVSATNTHCSERKRRFMVLDDYCSHASEIPANDAERTAALLLHSVVHGLFAVNPGEGAHAQTNIYTQ